MAKPTKIMEVGCYGSALEKVLDPVTRANEIEKPDKFQKKLLR
jgi:hypothetical protein